MRTRQIDFQKLYQTLYNRYGPRGWWPLCGLGYHPQDYDVPKMSDERFEICLGAILTQNTNWINVEKAITNLSKWRLLNAKTLLDTSCEELISLIKPAGCYNQKVKKLKIFADFFLNLEGETPSREALLKLWGVGCETADSILLYAYKVPTFVVDAYTERLLLSLNLIDESFSYNEIKALFEKSMTPDFIIYQEYHALIVHHAKESKKPDYQPLF